MRYAFYFIVYKKGLSTPFHFIVNGPFNGCFVIGRKIGFNGQSVFGGRFDDAQISDAHHGHLKCSGNRGGGNGQHIHQGTIFFEGFFLFDAEALFFINNDEPQICE